MTRKAAETADSEERLWTVEDVADYLKVPVMRVYRMKSLPRLHVGRLLRFLPGDIRAWARAQRAS